jgi:hypothetical protein
VSKTSLTSVTSHHRQNRVKRRILKLLSKLKRNDLHKLYRSSVATVLRVLEIPGSDLRPKGSYPYSVFCVSPKSFQISTRTPPATVPHYVPSK